MVEDGFREVKVFVISIGKVHVLANENVMKLRQNRTETERNSY